jgi:hypothetical protein
MDTFDDDPKPEESIESCDEQNDIIYQQFYCASPSSPKLEKEPAAPLFLDD